MLENRLKEFIKLTEDIDCYQEVLKKTEIEIIKFFLTSPKYRVTHEYDLPFDYSGISIIEENSYQLKDILFINLADLMEETYTGNSVATYMSGCGLFHHTLMDELDYIVRDIYFDSEKVVKLRDELSEKDDEELIDTICDMSIDNTYFILKITDYFKKINFIEIYKNSIDDTLKELLREKQEREDILKKEQEELLYYTNMFESFQKKYKLILKKRVTAEDINRLEKILKKDTFYAQEFLKCANLYTTNSIDNYSFSRGAVKRINHIVSSFL